VLPAGRPEQFGYCAACLCKRRPLVCRGVPGEADRQRRSFAEFRLPPGRHGIPADEVAANQRWRLLGAAAEVLAEQGHVNTTSTQVSKHAGVSPATFYQHFDNISDCLVAAYGAASG